MPILAAIGGLLLISVILWESFEVIILPRRVTRRIRLVRLIYRVTWTPFSAMMRRMHNVQRREGLLSIYGPLALMLQLGVWVVVLVVGFALLQWAFGSGFAAPEKSINFGTDLYMSGTTFFTLGLGDVVPLTGIARVIAVAEAGTGFSFLAVVIGYFPVLYQAFSRREVSISLLDARAGSPSSAVELLRRYSLNNNVGAMNQFLYDWERWSAELLESHLSYPSLAYFRSQHDNQSWLTALTTILDACALIMVGIDNIPPQQARLTFAMALHAAADLSQIFGVPHCTPRADRLSAADFARLRLLLAEADVPLRDEHSAAERLSKLRVMYEPYVHELSEFLVMALPSWLPGGDNLDDWQTHA